MRGPNSVLVDSGEKLLVDLTVVLGGELYDFSLSVAPEQQLASPIGGLPTLPQIVEKIQRKEMRHEG